MHLPQISRPMTTSHYPSLASCIAACNPLTLLTCSPASTASTVSPHSTPVSAPTLYQTPRAYTSVSSRNLPQPSNSPTRHLHHRSTPTCKPAPPLPNRKSPLPPRPHPVPPPRAPSSVALIFFQQVARAGSVPLVKPSPPLWVGILGGRTRDRIVRRVDCI